jgi:hypothetical protein
MFFAIALDVLVALYILSRQRRIRSVPRRLSLRFPVVVGVIGLIDLLSYSDTHHPSHHDYLWLLGTLVVGGLLLGAIRALTVKIWTSNSWVVRQGTGLTMALWVVSLVLHFLGGIGAQHAGAANLEASSFLLYLGLTYGVQNFVVHRRAVPLWNALGPEAGQRLHVNFGQGPGGPGAFFATFRGDGQGFSAGSGRAASHDPTIIDAEVVDDDEGPPQLR